MFSVGSEPIDKKQTIGTRGSLSIHNASMSRITPSAYFNNNNNSLGILQQQQQTEVI